MEEDVAELTILLLCQLVIHQQLQIDQLGHFGYFLEPLLKLHHLLPHRINLHLLLWLLSRRHLLRSRLLPRRLLLLILNLHIDGVLLGYFWLGGLTDGRCINGSTGLLASQNCRGSTCLHHSILLWRLTLCPPLSIPLDNWNSILLLRVYTGFRYCTAYTL